MEQNLNNPPSDAAALSTIREDIDAIDDQILDLLNRRAKLAQHVAEIKMAAGEMKCFHRPEREAEVLNRMATRNTGPLSRNAIVRFFREVMSECLALEMPLSVAFLGPAGTFTQQAAYKHFGHAINSVPMPTIEEVFRAVETGDCHYGVVPVENSTEGVITHTLDSFLRSSLIIAGEVSLRIHHNLMSHAPAIAEIREVYSHQQSLAQCREWLDHNLPNARRTAVSSNAEAARLAVSDPATAAIAGNVAAEMYGVPILACNIEDESDNTTRFLVIGRNAVGPTGNDKSTLLLVTRNLPGALHEMLEPFARHGLSLSKIESRPSRRVAWDYVFFVDVDGHREEQALADTLAELEPKVAMLKVLGSYPRAL